ncbi:MAG: ferredoxin [Hyphomicrobiales bacterium]|jgi:hypothetical protein|nr:MAG: ferredoxin [Hyphomicrobiales bacterium]
MYVILTDKPGEFHTEIGPGFEPVSAFDYLFYGHKRARFTIARLEKDVRMRLIDEANPGLVNIVPTKFLEKFDSVEEAREELSSLTSFGGMDTRLVPALIEVARSA